MTDPTVDDVARRIADRSRPLDPALLARIAQDLEGRGGAVQPLPPAWMLVGQLLVACAAIAAAGAAWAGFDGWAALAGWQRAVLLATLAVLGAVMARESVARWIPGSRVHFGAPALLVGSCAVLEALLVLLLRDYRAEHFIANGLGCLEQGVLHAIPAAILGALVVHRGCATRPGLAALTGGALAGLTGVVFLELHCANLEAPHQLVWHTAVVPVSAALGAIAAGLLRWYPR